MDAACVSYRYGHKPKCVRLLDLSVSAVNNLYKEVRDRAEVHSDSKLLKFAHEIAKAAE